MYPYKLKQSKGWKVINEIMWTVIWRKVNKCIWASNGEWYLPNVSNICALWNVKYIFRSHCDERLQIQILAFFIIFFLIFWCHTTTQLMCQLSCALGCRAQKKEIGWKKPSHIYIWRWHSWSWNKMKRRMHLGSWFHTLAVGLLRRPRRNRRSVYSGNLFQPSLTFSPGMPCPASPSLQRHIHSEPGDRKAECKHI